MSSVRGLQVGLGESSDSGCPTVYERLASSNALVDCENRTRDSHSDCSCQIRADQRAKYASVQVSRGGSGDISWRSCPSDSAMSRDRSWSGMARSRAKARVNWDSQGQRRGRCRVRRRAERVRARCQLRWRRNAVCGSRGLGSFQYPFEVRLAVVKSSVGKRASASLPWVKIRCPSVGSSLADSRLTRYSPLPRLVNATVYSSVPHGNPHR